MFRSLDEIMRDLAKIARQRAAVKASLLSEAGKARLLAQIDAAEAALSVELEAFSPASPGSSRAAKGS